MKFYIKLKKTTGGFINFSMIHKPGTHETSKDMFILKLKTFKFKIVKKFLWDHEFFGLNDINNRNKVMVK